MQQPEGAAVQGSAERLRGDPPGGAVRRRRPGVLLGGGGMGVQAAVQGPGPALL